MRWRYRPQRGSLTEAMAEMVEVDNFAALIQYLRDRHPNYGPAFSDVAPSYGLQLLPYGDDPRLGWTDVFLVFQINWGPIGYACPIV